MQLQDQFRRCLTSIEEIPDEYREASTSGCGLWDDVSGGWLPTNGVLRAPKEELEYVHAWRDAGASAKHCCVTCPGEGKMFHLLCMWNRISRKAVLQRRMGQRPEGGMRSRAKHINEDGNWTEEDDEILQTCVPWHRCQCEEPPFLPLPYLSPSPLPNPLPQGLHDASSEAAWCHEDREIVCISSGGMVRIVLGLLDQTT